jgi:hypothetical protein
VIYNQTVQLVIFYLHLLLHTCVPKFDVMERERKNLKFGSNLDEAQGRKTTSLLDWTVVIAAKKSTRRSRRDSLQSDNQPDRSASVADWPG